MREEVLAILQEIHNNVNFSEATDYLEQGLLDSYDIMTLVEMIEDHFDIQVGGRDIITENFCNMDAICALITKYKEA